MTSPGVLEPLYEALRCATLESLVKPQRIISLDTESTVDDALQTLSQHKLLAAPVRRRGSSSPSEGAVFLDIEDILTNFMEALGDDVLSEAKAMLRRMRLLEERGVEFSQTPLHALKSFGSDGLVFPAAEAASWPLDRVLRQGFLRPHSARAGAPSPTHVTHRLGLCDERGEVRAVVTQTDVARWLDRALDALPELAAASARDLGLGTGGLIGVRPDTPALEALGLMRSSGVSAVVVRDADGGLVGNFSASDMRSILAEHFGALALPVGEFLAREHGTEYAGYAVQSEEEGDARAKNLEFLERRSSRPGYEVGQDLVTCMPTSSLKHVVEKLVKNGLHRLYVVDDELKPTGVITLTDILSRVCLEPEQAEA